jgi:hypothetical protein
MKRRALVPLITFDIVLNVYLTSLFLHPLRRKYMKDLESVFTYADSSP